MLLQYKLLPFADTNSVICKMIVGERWECPRAIDNRPYKYAPTFLNVGAGIARPQTSVKRRKIYYEGHRGAMRPLPVAEKGSRASGRGLCATQPHRWQGEHRAPQQGLSEEWTIWGEL